MYGYFYIIMLVAAILLGIAGFLFGSIGRKHPKIWGIVLTVLVVIVVAALIGFLVTLPWGR